MRLWSLATLLLLFSLPGVVCGLQGSNTYQVKEEPGLCSEGALLSLAHDLLSTDGRSSKY